MAEEQFYTILTNVGKAKIANATLLNSDLTLKTLKVGDGNGTYYNPTEDQEDLKNTVHECAIGAIYIDKKNPNWIISETIIPGSVGGFTIREVGLFDAEGDMIAVGKYPETYKPVVANGASKDLNVRTIFEVSNAENVTLNLDPSVIIATKEDINNLQEQIDENTAQLNESMRKKDLPNNFNNMDNLLETGIYHTVFTTPIVNEPYMGDTYGRRVTIEVINISPTNAFQRIWYNDGVNGGHVYERVVETLRGWNEIYNSMTIRHKGIVVEGNGTNKIRVLLDGEKIKHDIFVVNANPLANDAIVVGTSMINNQQDVEITLNKEISSPIQLGILYFV